MQEAVTSRASSASFREKLLSLGAVAGSSVAHFFQVLSDTTTVFLVKFKLMEKFPSRRMQNLGMFGDG